jgi:DNA-binding response OmpR family regulator
MVKRILIVDDEETLTFSLYQSFILSKHPYEVVTAGSGEEALQKFDEKPFDLIITDIFLPGISGIDILKYIREKIPDAKVIIITAYGSEEKRNEALNNGALLYVEKPFDIIRFKQRVMEILE